MSNKISLKERVKEFFKFKNEKNLSDTTKPLQKMLISLKKAIDFLLSKRGARAFKALLFFGAGIELVFIGIYFFPLGRVPSISIFDHILEGLFLFSEIALFLFFVSFFIYISTTVYRDAFVKKTINETSEKNIFSKFNASIIKYFSIIMLIDLVVCFCYGFFNIHINYLAFLGLLFLGEYIIFLYPSFLVFEKFENSELSVSGWKIIVTFWCSRLFFFMYGLGFYFLVDHSFRTNSFFFPILQWLFFIWTFMFITDKRELMPVTVILSLFGLIFSVFINLGVLKNIDNSFMAIAGVRQEHMAVSFDEKICDKLAEALQCQEDSLYIKSCSFYPVEIPSAIGEEELVNVSFQQFKEQTHCEPSEAIKKLNPTFVQVSVNRHDIFPVKILYKKNR
jgi:hypothetical protein